MSVKPIDSKDDEIREEYPEELKESGERRKYAKQYRVDTNVVLIDPNLHESFPDSESANKALRYYVASKQNATYQQGQPGAKSLCDFPPRYARRGLP